MTIHENLTKLHGFDVVDFEAGEPLPDPTQTAVRLAIRYDGPFKSFSDLWAEFIDSDGVERIEALVIGNWADPDDGQSPSEQAAALLVSSADRLPGLRALFFGDIVSEENEISWIEQSDLSALWGAFPRLEEFGVRGGNRLQLGAIRHAKLRTLKVEAGGLPRNVVREIGAADLPALEHLEVWLGTGGYGGDSRPEDLAGILDGRRFPKLVTLALRNCEWADELAATVATAPILCRVRRLDLSMGTLGDAGVDALVASPAVHALEHIDIAHHYVSDAGIAKLTALGIGVNAANRQKPDTHRGEEHRYIAVSE
jgi:hypothetical protein